MDEPNKTPEISTTKSDTLPTVATTTIETDNKKYIVITILVAIVILALVVYATIFLVNPDHSNTTEQIRDVFIIFMAVGSLIFGVAMIVLIIQLSTLINLLQNEIRPILNSTNETVNTLKGTTRFISDHLTEPVIKLNQFMAMIKQLVKPSKR